MKSIFIGEKEIKKGICPYILAEMACAHDGDINIAKQIVCDAADSGADGIQFQVFTTENLLTPKHKFFSKVRALEISYPDWKEIFKIAKEKGLKVHLNPLTIDALDIVNDIEVDVLKIHSADISNPDLVKSLINFNLPISISVGGSTLEEIKEIIDMFHAEGAEDIILMHGFQAYPTLLENTNLNFISTLEKEFNLNVGYQDHIDGSSELSKIIPAVAYTLGAVLIEKHITDNRKRKGTDYQSALDKNGFIDFVRILKNVYTSLGSDNKKYLSDAEIEYRRIFKKSIVAARDIKKNEIFTKDLIKFMRGDHLGIEPKNLNYLLNKRATKNINKYEIIDKKDFK